MAPQVSKKRGRLPPDHHIVSLPARATASIRNRFPAPFPCKDDIVKAEAVHVK